MAEFLEYSGMKDIYCSGLHRIEAIGDGNVRLHLYVIREKDWLVAASIVMSARALPDIVIKTMEALAHDGDKTAKSFPVVENSLKN